MNIEDRKYLLENELEQYLIQNGYDIYDVEVETIDSLLVAEYAIELGFIPYRLESENGELQDTYLFARR